MKVMEDVVGAVRTDGSWHEANCFLDGHVVARAKGIRPLMGHVMKNLNHAAAVAVVVACICCLGPSGFSGFWLSYCRNSLL